MAGNRGVAYIEPGKVEVQQTDYPKLELQDGPGVNPANVGRKLNHGVILKVVTTNICGSDQHMVRGRTTAPPNLVLGHEITGEVVEKGSDVEFIQVGDVCSVPFNIACGRCRNCKEGKTGICLNVNPARPGAAYGYVDMGGWVGGQAEYVTVPYAEPGRSGLTFRQIPVLPSLQLRQRPQEMLNGTEHRSPTLMNSTPGPTSTTSPVISCPRTNPSGAVVRPRTMCWSLPQMLVATFFRITACGSWRPMLAGFTPGPSLSSKVG